MPTKNIAPNKIKIKQHQAGEINLFKEKFITSYFEKKQLFFYASANKIWRLYWNCNVYLSEDNFV